MIITVEPVTSFLVYQSNRKMNLYSHQKRSVREQIKDSNYPLKSLGPIILALADQAKKASLRPTWDELERKTRSRKRRGKGKSLEFKKTSIRGGDNSTEHLAWHAQSSEFNTLGSGEVRMGQHI